MSNNVYDKLGASATKDEVHAAIKNVDKGLYPTAFCKILKDIYGSKNYVSVMHADGVGTKSILAYLYYKEKGDPTYFKSLAQDSIVMNVDDLLCIGITSGMYISNIIGRNAHRVKGDAVEQIIAGYTDFIKTLNKFGVQIVEAGGETADVGDLVATTDINSTIYARIRKNKLITMEKVKPGDVIVGLSSYGKATYENKDNSGIGSNGLTAARHLLLKKDYAKKYPEIMSTTLSIDDAYSGKFELDDKLYISKMTIGEAILSPTRTYAPIIKELLDSSFNEVHGIVHNTGGGLTKSMKFGYHPDGLNYVKDNLIDSPLIFNAIQEAGRMNSEEMYKTFNMGQRMEIYVDEKDASKVLDAAHKYEVGAKIIGHIEKSETGSNMVTIKDAGKTHKYGMSK